MDEFTPEGEYKLKLFQTAESIQYSRRNSPLSERDTPARLLRNAAMKLIEGDESAPRHPVAERGEYTLTYGDDTAVYRQSPERFPRAWDTYGPREDASRLRVILKDADELTPAVAGLLAAAGARFVYHERADSQPTDPAEHGEEAYHFVQEPDAPEIAEFSEWLETNSRAAVLEAQQ